MYYTFASGGMPINHEKKKVVSFRLKPSQIEYLKQKYGSVGEGIEILIDKDREGINGIKLPGNSRLREVYVFLYRQRKDFDLKVRTQIAIRWLMKHFEVQERTARAWLKSLEAAGFVRSKNFTLEIIERKED